MIYKVKEKRDTVTASPPPAPQQRETRETCVSLSLPRGPPARRHGTVWNSHRRHRALPLQLERDDGVLLLHGLHLFAQIRQPACSGTQVAWESKGLETVWCSPSFGSGFHLMWFEGLKPGGFGRYGSHNWMQLVCTPPHRSIGAICSSSAACSAWCAAAL
jgi:hypothetical protein